MVWSPEVPLAYTHRTGICSVAHAECESFRVVVAPHCMTDAGMCTQVLHQLQDQFSDYTDMNEAILIAANRQLRLLYSKCHRITFPVPLHKQLPQKILPNATAMRQQVVTQIMKMVDKGHQINFCPEALGKALATEDVEFLQEQEQRRTYRESLLLQQVEHDITEMLVDDIVADILRADEALEALQGKQFGSVGESAATLPGDADAAATVSRSPACSSVVSLDTSDTQDAQTHASGPTPNTCKADREACEASPCQSLKAGGNDTEVTPGDGWHSADGMQQNVYALVSGTSDTSGASAAIGPVPSPASLPPTTSQRVHFELKGSESPDSAEEVSSEVSGVSAHSSHHGSTPPSTKSSQSSDRCSDCLEDGARDTIPALECTSEPALAYALDDGLSRDQPGLNVSVLDASGASHESSQAAEAPAGLGHWAAEGEGATGNDVVSAEDDVDLIRSWSSEQDRTRQDTVIDASDVSLHWVLNDEDIFTVDALRSAVPAATSPSEHDEWDPQHVLPQVRPLSLLSKCSVARAHFSRLLM